jgi:hypothetical protein
MNINMVKFGTIIIVNKGFLNTNTMVIEGDATNANNENARSRMEATSVRKHWYRERGR